jgi:hypothetical protein
MVPPFVPRVEGELDVRNIDKIFTKEPPRETPEEDTTLRTSPNKKFENFTYVQ